jgi:serine/threonine protein kinase
MAVKQGRDVGATPEGLDENPVHAPNHDAFFLHHLQSVKGEAAWYINHRFVGKGGNGTTFLVTCTSGINQGVQFALKVFHRISDDRRRERFLDEVRHYRSLNHPSIIKVYDEGSYNSGDRRYPFAVIDFVPDNLETVLGRGLPRITRLQAIRYIYNIASGVGYLHSQDQPIVHRDIKPANILVHGHSASLGDLGLAKVLMGGDDENVADIEAYAAMPYFHRTPELVAIARGSNKPLTPASDIYQLGLVLYRAITGFNPQRPPRDNIREDIELDVRAITGAGGVRLEQLLASMLADDPNERPDATQLLQGLNLVHREVCEADWSATGVMR